MNSSFLAGPVPILQQVFLLFVRLAKGEYVPTPGLENVLSPSFAIFLTAFGIL